MVPLGLLLSFNPTDEIYLFLFPIPAYTARLAVFNPLDATLVDYACL